MARIDYFNDPDAPAANSLVPAASAVVTDGAGRILLQRRADNGMWALPGGAMNLGESVAECAVRETKEETGFDVEVVGVVGIYSDPRHVFAYSDGEVRQEFSICLLCRATGGVLAASDESTEVDWFTCDELAGLPMVPSIRLRLMDHLEGRTPAIR
jgi:ADP-ribose pyrophosphatase YjhB (NUDIX family)